MFKKLLEILISASILATMLIGCSNDNSNSETTGNTTAHQETTDENTTVGTPSAPINIDELTYPQYNALTAEQQQEVMESFDSVENFIQWHNEAKKEHEEFQEFINQGSTNEGTEPTVDENTESTAPDVTDPAADDVTFEEYQAMSGNEQRRFMMSFPSIDAFMQWHANAVQEYKDNMTEWGSSNKPTDPTIPIPTIETEG